MQVLLWPLRLRFTLCLKYFCMASFVDPFVLCMFHVCLYYTVASVPCSLVITYWERADLLALLCVMFLLLYPRYEVYRGYIVFAFSVIMVVSLFVCLSVCLSVCKLFSVKDFSATRLRILKFGTQLDSDESYSVTKKQPHIAYQY